MKSQLQKLSLISLSAAVVAIIIILNQSDFLAEKEQAEQLFFTLQQKSAIVDGDTLEWKNPRFPARKEDRQRLVRRGLKQQGISNKKVLEAMSHVPRHLFVPDYLQNQAYLNEPLPIGKGQTISQPYIVAYMTQLLDLKAGEKVLEIGTGSGYQAAVLSEITPYIYTIEIIEELGKQARARFEKLGYKTIKTKIGDGYKGWEKYAPFDGIIITAAADQIPTPLTKQLKPGGILVMPKGGTGQVQYLIRVKKTNDGKLRTNRKLPVRFVPMTGEVQSH